MRGWSGAKIGKRYELGGRPVNSWKLRPPVALDPLGLSVLLAPLLLSLLSAACSSTPDRPPATAQPRPPAQSTPSSEQAGSGMEESSGGDLVPVNESDDILSMSLEDINAQSPLEDIRFGYDSAELTPQARNSLDANTQWLRRNPTVTILVEGHCDERGTVEYNLALGERRAMAAYNFMVSSGIPGERIKTISYGKEFPVNPGHNETAWTENRRAHFVITSK